MATRTWKVSLDGQEHSVTLEHGYFSGKRRITVNGGVVEEIKSNLMDMGSEHPIQLGNHPAIVSVRVGALSFKYDLYVDGVSVQDGKPHRPQRASRAFAPGGPKPVGFKFSKWALAGMFMGNILLGVGNNLSGDTRILFFVFGGALVGGAAGSIGFQVVRGTRKLANDSELPVGVIPEGWLYEFHTTYPVTTVLSDWASRHKYEEVRLPEWPQSRFFRQGGTWLQRRVVQVDVDGRNVKINAWIDMGGGASVPLERDNNFALPTRKCRKELRDLLDRLGQ